MKTKQETLIKCRQQSHSDETNRTSGLNTLKDRTPDTGLHTQQPPSMQINQVLYFTRFPVGYRITFCFSNICNKLRNSSFAKYFLEVVKLMSKINSNVSHTNAHNKHCIEKNRILSLFVPIARQLNTLLQYYDKLSMNAYS